MVRCQAAVDLHGDGAVRRGDDREDVRDDAERVFRPYFGPTMQCACEGLTFDSTNLHEFAYAAFANLAKVMGDELLRVLGELVPHLATVTGQDEERFE